MVLLLLSNQEIDYIIILQTKTMMIFILIFSLQLKNKIPMGCLGLDSTFFASEYDTSYLGGNNVVSHSYIAPSDGIAPVDQKIRSPSQQHITSTRSEEKPIPRTPRNL